jgi:hypothetical protein
MRRIVTISAVLLAIIVTAASARAQIPAGWDVGAPPIVPRVTIVLEPQRVYADPRMPSIETGLTDLSLPSIQDALERTLDADPRFDVPTRSATAGLLEASREPTRAELDFIARQSARLGIDSFRAWHIATAIDQLERATEAFDQTAVAWLEGDIVADTWLHLALAHLERARTDSENAARHRAHARAALRNVVRFAPTRRLDVSEWPPSVIDAWTEAWVEMLVEGGDGLSLTADEARRLSDWLDADQLVELLILVDRDGHRLVVRVWDSVDDRFVVRETVAIEPTTRDALEALGTLLSRAIACQPLVAPPVTDDPHDDDGRIYASAGWTSSMWLSTVTRRRFLNQGVHLGSTIFFTDNAGLWTELDVLFSMTDPDGDLVNRVQTVRGTIGASVGARFGRWRVYGATGFEVGRVSRVRATTSFWCKVSEGEVRRFDDERACEPGDVIDESPTATAGLELRVGTSRRVAGSTWIDLGLSTTLLVAPVEDRTFDFPVGVDLGMAWRF